MCKLYSPNAKKKAQIVNLLPPGAAGRGAPPPRARGKAVFAFTTFLPPALPNCIPRTVSTVCDADTFPLDDWGASMIAVLLMLIVRDNTINEPTKPT